MSDSAHAAFESFEGKWLDANPEQTAVQVFLDDAARIRTSAFGTLIHEISQTTFGVRETSVAAAKLDWWRQELMLAANGKARHPISRRLFSDEHVAKIDRELWGALAHGGLSQLDVPSATDYAALRNSLARFYAPVPAIELRLAGHASGDADATAALWIASHLALVAEAGSPFAERTPLPLDLFARHGVQRADIDRDHAARAKVVGDFLQRVRQDIAANLPRASTIARRVRAYADARAIDAALKSPDPSVYLARQARRARLRNVWRAWREARAAGT